MNPIALPEKNRLLYINSSSRRRVASAACGRCSDINLNKSQCYIYTNDEWKTIDCFLKEKISIFLIIPLFHFTHTFVAVNHHRYSIHPPLPPIAGLLSCLFWFRREQIAFMRIHPQIFYSATIVFSNNTKTTKKKRWTRCCSLLCLTKGGAKNILYRK